MLQDWHNQGYEPWLQYPDDSQEQRKAQKACENICTNKPKSGDFELLRNAIYKQRFSHSLHHMPTFSTLSCQPLIKFTQPFPQPVKLGTAYMTNNSYIPAVSLLEGRPP